MVFVYAYPPKRDQYIISLDKLNTPFRERQLRIREITNQDINQQRKCLAISWKSFLVDLDS